MIRCPLFQVSKQLTGIRETWLCVLDIEQHMLTEHGTFIMYMS